MDSPFLHFIKKIVICTGMEPIRIVDTPEDLLLELLDDQRFIADDPEDQEMLRVVRKKNLK